MPHVEQKSSWPEERPLCQRLSLEASILRFFVTNLRMRLDTQDLQPDCFVLCQSTHGPPVNMSNAYNELYKNHVMDFKL